MAADEIMVVAGEASGDQHAADLLGALQALLPGQRFFGMGGAKLRAKGVELLYEAHEVSVMGITEVIPKLWRILQILRGLASAAKERRPRAAILVDIPDFNLRLAKKLKALGIPVIYYVSPMVWAWRQGRVKQIARTVNRMLCILPFEEAFYRERGVPAVYVGSPVLEQMPTPKDQSAFRSQLRLPSDAPMLALLPGSRLQEIERLLPDMAKTAELLAKDKPGLQVVIPVAPSIPKERIQAPFKGSSIQPILVEGHAPEAVGASDMALVASGTAALEAGLMNRPFVVVYRVSRLSYWVGRLFLKVAHVALVNLLAGRRVVPELLQDQFTPQKGVAELRKLWEGPKRVELLNGLVEVRAKLGEPGAARRAAQEVLAVLQETR